jgi:hypothetical protein
LKKTPPPVIIFCENKNDVDDIHEYLMLKGVDAVGLHGGKSNFINIYINIIYNLWLIYIWRLIFEGYTRDTIPFEKINISFRLLYLKGS